MGTVSPVPVCRGTGGLPVLPETRRACPRSWRRWPERPGAAGSWSASPLLVLRASSASPGSALHLRDDRLPGKSHGASGGGDGHLCACQCPPGAQPCPPREARDQGHPRVQGAHADVTKSGLQAASSCGNPLCQAFEGCPLLAHSLFCTSEKAVPVGVFPSQYLPLDFDRSDRILEGEQSRHTDVTSE